MRIQLLTCMATAYSVLNVGDIVERDTAEAVRLITAGLAVRVNEVQSNQLAAERGQSQRRVQREGIKQ